MWRLLLCCSMIYAVQCSCPQGFELTRDGQCRGQYTQVVSTYDKATNAAISKCTEIQSQLITIHNDEQYSYWINRQKEAGDFGANLVLGLQCNTSSKRVQWVDGSDMDYEPPGGIDAETNCDPACVWMLSGHFHKGCGTTTTTFNIFCTEQLYQPVHSSDGCDNFEDDNDDGVCYQVGITALNYQDAQMICKERGASLASIHSQKENSFVRRLAVSKGKVDGIYLGATYSEKGSKFKWDDGSKWNYDNFYPGFPISGLGDCLMMDTDGTTGEWANIDCSTKLSVACKRQQNYSEPLTCTSGPWTEGELIHSPGFPFDSSTPCDFILSVEAGKRVQVEILMLEANSCCDKLIIFENYFGGNVVANLTGEINDELFNTTSSNFARVSWQPNGGVNVRGMMMTFRAVD